MMLAEIVSEFKQDIEKTVYLTQYAQTNITLLFLNYRFSSEKVVNCIRFAARLWRAGV